MSTGLPNSVVASNTNQNQGEAKEKKKKESILDLRKYLDKGIRVKFSGGREASGILKGYDQLLNLVLDNTVEYLRGVYLRNHIFSFLIFFFLFYV